MTATITGIRITSLPEPVVGKYICGRCGIARAIDRSAPRNYCKDCAGYAKRDGWE